MSRDLHFRWYALLAFALTVGWCWYVFTKHPPAFHYQDTFVPARHFAGLMEFPEGSIHRVIYQELPLMAPKIIAWVSRGTGLSLEVLHVGLAVSSILAGLMGVFFWAARLGRHPVAGLVAMLALPASLAMSEVNGYPANFWNGFMALGMMAMGWLVGLWCLWMVLPAGKLWRTVLLYGLAGVFMLLHSTYAAIFLLAFGLGEVLRLLTAEVRFGVWMRHQLVGGVVFLGIAFPQLQGYAEYFTKVAEPLNDEQWWTLMGMRKASHLFIWINTTCAAAAAFFALAGGMVWLLRQEINPAQWAQYVGTVLAVGFCCLLSFLAVTAYLSPTIAGVVLSRGMVLLSALVITGAAALAMLAREKSPGYFLLMCLLLVVVASPPFIDWTHYVPVGLVLVVVAERYVERLSPRLLAWVVLALVLVWWPAKKQLIKEQGRVAHSVQWDALTEWTETTAKDALFLAPPYPYFNGKGSRAHILDYALTGFSIYTKRALPVEVKALKVVYGLDLAAYTRVTIHPLVAGEGGILCLFEGRYLKVLESRERVREIKAAYPELDYVIGFQQGVRPMEWTCKTQEAPLLALPIAYQNDHYVVYDVKDIH